MDVADLDSDSFMLVLILKSLREIVEICLDEIHKIDNFTYRNQIHSVSYGNYMKSFCQK